MHLLVLSAFRHYSTPKLTGGNKAGLNAPFGAQCFPTQVYAGGSGVGAGSSQCTFWCSVLSDRPSGTSSVGAPSSLNAPFGAQCFPTVSARRLPHPGIAGLNAPFGAQCFPTFVVSRLAASALASQCTFWCSVLSDLFAMMAKKSRPLTVSMHLLVLSAFRPV